MQGDGSQVSCSGSSADSIALAPATPNPAGSIARSHDGRPMAAAAPPLPDYLVRHYWWAYLWRPTVWFFDHQPIIDCIVFGQYTALREQTLALLDGDQAGDTLLIASAYGDVVPGLARTVGPDHLTVIDVAPIQIERARSKLLKAELASGVNLALMDAECLSYGDDRFDSSVFFLLLHELPPPVRRRVVSEALRVTRPGGRLVLAEYGAETDRHPFHRWRPLRWLFGMAEPFLPTLWALDLDRLIVEQAAALGKRAIVDVHSTVFDGFYRINRYRIEAA